MTPCDLTKKMACLMRAPQYLPFCARFSRNPPNDNNNFFREIAKGISPGRDGDSGIAFFGEEDSRASMFLRSVHTAVQC